MAKKNNRKKENENTALSCADLACKKKNSPLKPNYKKRSIFRKLCESTKQKSKTKKKKYEEKKSCFEIFFFDF